MEGYYLDAFQERWWLIIPTALAFTTGRYVILSGMAWLLCYSPGLRRLKKYKIQPLPPKKKQVQHELRYSLSTIFIFSMVGMIVYVLDRNGFTTFYTRISEYGWVYFFASLLLMIVLHDTYFYWTHRLLHTKWFFKRIHTIHHRSVNPTPLSAYSFHPVEAFIESLVVFPFIMIWPVHFLAFFIFTFLVLVMNVIGHLGFEFLPEKIRTSPAGQYLTSSTHHNLHHQKSTRNFGYYFTFWDRMMKTLHLLHDQNRFTHQVKPSDNNKPTLS